MDYDLNTVESMAGSSFIDLVQETPSNAEVMQQLDSSGEVVTRVELDLACSSEKLVNLSILRMHVATRENDFESAFALEKENMSCDTVEKALEYNFLSGIFDSEVREMDSFMATLQHDIANAREVLSSCEIFGETFMEEKLRDSEEALKQSRDQVLEMMEQSSKFQETLLCFGGEGNWSDEKGTEFVENDPFINWNSEMQTAEQRRHILRMLEKSLARELDLEKKLSESRQAEEETKLKLQSSEHEVFCLEEAITNIWERLFEAENAAEVLMGISREFRGRLQLFQFNLNGSMKREGDLKLKLQNFTEQLNTKENTIHELENSSQEVNDILLAQVNTLKSNLREVGDKLILADSEAFTLREKVSLLEKQVKESEFQLLNANQHDTLYSDINELQHTIEDLKKDINKAENRAESAEGKCKLLTEANMELNEELSQLKGDSSSTAEKVDLLERQLQHAVATSEAGQEKQAMLQSMIEDMENLIEDLKSKVSKAEDHAESAEDKCIILSEANMELDEELRFMRARTESLETSLRKAEEAKRATAKDIGIRTKLIMDLVMQLAIGRERLQKQLTSLMRENKVLVEKLEITNKDASVVTCHKDEHDQSTATPGKESVGSSFEPDEKAKEAFLAETVRTVDIWQLNFKHFMALFFLLLSVLAVYVFRQEKCPF